MKLRTILPILAAMLLVVFTTGCKEENVDVNNDNNTGVIPTVLSNSPLNKASDIARNKVISVTFSEAMDSTTINSSSFKVKQGTADVQGIVAYAGVTATFTPYAKLLAASDYTVTINTLAKSKKGVSFKSDSTWSFTTGGSLTGIAKVNLGTSGNYVILAKTAINNSSTSAVTGDLGLSPAATSYITGMALTDFTGYALSAQVTGKVYAADMVAPTSTNLTTAVENMITAYNDAAGRKYPDFLELKTGIMGGSTLTPGLYKWTNTVSIPSNITISGSATDIWIFQIAGDLTMASATNIILSGGAKASNIFWQVAGQVTCGTTSHFEGVILSMTGIIRI